jgi:seryl-tRNA synthetase
MFDPKYLEQNLESVKTNLSKRGFDISILDSIAQKYHEKREYIQKVEKNRAEVKSLSKEIGQLKRSGQDADELMQKVTKLKTSNVEDETELEALSEKILYIMSTIPNMISEDTPEGKDEEENVEVFKFGEIPTYDFEVKDHTTLGENLGMLDFETGAKVTGSRFVFYKKDFARLERALINYMLESHREHGYEEIIPPFIVHERSLYGTGQLPKFSDDLFKIQDQDWYLIPTAEVPLTNMLREQISDKSQLPLKVCAYTPCFRSEAGSYGKDTKGLIRLHQFNKVEMVNIVEPSQSKQAHEDMVGRARSILEELKLPYRGVILCSGDIGFGSQKTYDLEVWLPSQDKYREISSISNCGDFQARRADIRFRNEQGKPEFAHTLNGSGLAVGRTLVAIVENYQRADGSIAIPEVLQSYMGGQKLISLN